MYTHTQNRHSENDRALLSPEDQEIISISEHPELPAVSDTYYNCGDCNDVTALSPSVIAD